MKELTIQEKVKAYDEAIIRGSRLWESGIITRENYEYIFPELKESEGEGERIRKTLIKFFEDWGKTKSHCWNVPVSKIIAWLKKQDEKGTNGNERKILNFEQKLTDKIQIGKKYKCIASPRYSTFMIGKIYKPEDKFLCSLMNFCSDCFEPIEDGNQKTADKVEQKPTMWCKEDEEMLNQVIEDIVRLAGPRVSYNVDVTWLESLKNKVLPKQEWSEEDEKIYSKIYDLIRAAAFANYDVDEDGKELGEYAKITDWFKSLKDRVQLQSNEKLSKEDSIRLQRIIDFLWYNRKGDIDTIYQQEKDIEWLKSLLIQE